MSAAAEALTHDQLQLAYRQLYRPGWPSTLELALEEAGYAWQIRLRARTLNRALATAPANAPLPPPRPAPETRPPVMLGTRGAGLGPIPPRAPLPPPRPATPKPPRAPVQPPAPAASAPPAAPVQRSARSRGQTIRQCRAAIARWNQSVADLFGPQAAPGTNAPDRKRLAANDRDDD